MSDQDEHEKLRQTNRRLQRSVDELSILNRLAARIGAAGDCEQVIDHIVHQSRQAVSAEQVVISMLGRKDRNHLDTLARSITRSGQAFHLTQAMLGRMLHDPRPLLITDPAQDPRLAEVSIESGLDSLLCVPLLVQSRVIGILAACNKSDGGHFDKDDERLLTIIAAQSAQVIENARLYAEEKALAMVQKEVELAREIQLGLLPRQPPTVAGYDIVGRSVPALTVGGDYFDYFPISDERLVVCLGDVSGKGIPASLLMANLQATLRGQTPADTEAGACLTRVNRMLYHNTLPDKYASLFLGILEPAAHRLEYAIAGHEPPLMVAAVPQTLTSDGPVLGAIEEFDYRSKSIRLEIGDLLLVFSDGVTEAVNAQGEMFGKAALRSVLDEAAGLPSEAVVEAVLDAVTDHAGETPQRDDITLLAITRTA